MFTPRNSRSHLRSVPRPGVTPRTESDEHHFEEVPDAVREVGLLRQANVDTGWMGDYVRTLAGRVGGLEALEHLDEIPLPGEAFDWGSVKGVPLELVRVVVDLIDGACDRYGDIELRTVARRLWARIVVIEPRGIRQREPARLAAAVVWLAMKGNDAFRHRKWLTATLLWDHFGVGSCVDLGYSLLGQIGLRDEELERRFSSSSGNAVILPDPRLLTAAHRRRLLFQRADAIRTIEGELARREDAKLLRFLGGGRISLRMQPTSPPQFCFKVAGSGGSPVLAVGFGNDPAEPDQVLAITIVDARRLVALIDDAMGSRPLTTVV